MRIVRRSKPPPPAQAAVPKDWLRERIERADLGRWNTNGFYDHLLAAMQEGDELWSFSSPRRPLCWRAGVALVRDGEIVASITDLQS